MGEGGGVGGWGGGSLYYCARHTSCMLVTPAPRTLGSRVLITPYVGLYVSQ